MTPYKTESVPFFLDYELSNEDQQNRNPRGFFGLLPRLQKLQRQRRQPKLWLEVGLPMVDYSIYGIGFRGLGFIIEEGLGV